MEIEVGMCSLRCVVGRTFQESRRVTIEKRLRNVLLDLCETCDESNPVVECNYRFATCLTEEIGYDY